MTTPVQIIGSYISPYVRKVLAVLHLKGIAYEIDPIVPFFGDDRFTEISPLRRIPVYSDGKVTLCDSTVICEYLEDRHPAPALYPREPADRARARWLEEFADTRMGEVVIWRLFNQVAIKPLVLGVPTDEAVLRKRSTWSCRTCSTTSSRSCPRRASCSARSASPTSRSRRSSATPRSRATASTPRAGRAPRRSSIARSATSASRSSSRSRTPRCSVPPPSSAPRSRRPARRSRAETLGTDAPPRRGIMSI